MHSKWVSKAGGSEEIPRTRIRGDLQPNPRYFVNNRNLSHLTLEVSNSRLEGGLITETMVWKRTLGL